MQIRRLACNMQYKTDQKKQNWANYEFKTFECAIDVTEPLKNI